MNTEVFDYNCTVIGKSELKVVELTNDLHAYSLTVQHTEVDSTGTFTPLKSKLRTAFEEQGFIDNNNLERIKTGKSYETRNLKVMPFDLQEKLRQKGWRL